MTALLAGLGLGFSAGVSPGPLMSLVIVTTLARGFAAGLRVAIAPLLTDVLIIAATLIVVGSLPAWTTAALACAGGLFVIYLGVEAMRSARSATLTGDGRAQAGGADVRQGVLVNLLNPHPWIFWLTVGSPLLTAAWSQGAAEALAFLAGFYCLLVGSKVLVAAAIAGGRHWLNDRSYRLILRLSGALLLLFGALLLYEALTLVIP